MATVQTQAPQSNVHGQNVTKSKVILVVIGILLFATAFFAFTSWWNHRPKNYNLMDVEYGKILVIEIDHGYAAKVKLTKEWCPFWSDGQLDAYDDNGSYYVLEGKDFIQHEKGKDQGHQSMTWIFKNKSKNSIILKIGRCKSQTDCPIKF